MPFKSEAQRRFLFSQHPAIARRWTKKYGSKVVTKDAVDRKLKKHGRS